MVTDGLFQQEMLDLEIRNNYLCTWYCSPVALVPYRLTVEHLRPSELRTKTGTDGTLWVNLHIHMYTPLSTSTVIGKNSRLLRILRRGYTYINCLLYCDWQQHDWYESHVYVHTDILL